MSRAHTKIVLVAVLLSAMSIPALQAQMIDNTQATNTAGAGINKSLSDEIGAGRGDVLMPNSSVFIINRDPFRSIRRGRQLFQRKSSPKRKARGRMKATASAKSTLTLPSELACPTVARCVMAVRGDRREPGATS